MVRRGNALVSVGALVLIGALAGCSDEEKPPAPEIGGDATTASSTPTEETSAPETQEPFDDKGGESHRGRVQADDATEEAVADAWFGYWQVRARAYHTVKVDVDGLGQVATGEALDTVVGYVDYLEEKGLHTEGDSKFGLSNIEVRGKFAAVEACMNNKSVDRDANGRAAEDLTSWVNFVGTLEKVGGSWLVTTASSVGEKKCSV